MLGKKIGFDNALALAAGAIPFVLLLVWSYPGEDPHVWNDLAIASGLLPQGRMLPGLGSLLSRLVFSVFGFGDALVVNGFVAKLLVAGCGWMSYWAFSGMMELVSGNGARDWRRRSLAIRLASFVAALAFACSDPMWHVAQAVGGTGFLTVQIVVTVALFVRLLKTASFPCAILTLAFAGFLCAETPLGWVVLGSGVFLAVRYLGNSPSDAWKAFLDPVHMQRAKWSMTFAFIGSFLLGVFMEVFSFAMLDGMKAAGVTYGELPLLYAKTYASLVVSSVDVLGACLFVFLALIPFILSSVLVTTSTDEDHYLPFKFSIVYFLVGAIAFLQLSPFEFAWFWSVIDGSVRSGPLVMLGVLLSAVTFAWSVYVLCVEVLCRDYKHIENVQYQSYSDEDADAKPGREDAEVDSVRLSALRLSLLALPALLLFLVVQGRRLPEDRALLRLVYDFIGETLDECRETKYLFTDGSYDAALRLEARRRGVPVVPVSLMSGNSRRDAYVRQLGTEGFDDRMTLEAGAAETLRTWVVTNPKKLSDVSVQIAFEIFRLNRHVSPVVYGLLVRPAGGDDAEAQSSIGRCHRLADRIVALHESGTWRHAKDPLLKDRFLFAQFRLAVMSRLRAINLDAKGKVKESIEEIAFSDRLNACNPSLIKILRKMDWVRRQSGESLTPREGLEVAMKRADFVMARRYAMPVLREDPDEPNANFALGMSYYAEEQFSKAEEFLKRVLKRSPKEPAVYNNLALIQLKTGRLEEASKNAVIALKMMPESPEIKDTARQIQKAKATASQTKGKVMK